MLDAHAHVMQVKLCKANTRGVTESFITFLVKLAQSSAFLQDIAFATKNPKICNVGLSTIQELMWCLLFQWVTIEAVATIASRVDSFGPKRLTHIVLTQH